MSLPKFIVGMLFALAIVVAWSWLGGASLGTTLLRVVICAVVIQAGYFAVVYAMIARSEPTPADRLREAERKQNAPEVSEGEKLGSARRSLH
ncbi:MULTISPECIES: exopolysaccharide production repressor exox [unclassified Mesorhizobium]|uniref:exopolysaccharide production repressor exox n=1 Tax=unclassified Mesorhizobium TaxID=325217 RepID=UPI00112A1939|nr:MULTISPECIES: exopolysaccharide production repressor exox [unclassified Mesorhizobium]MBZ9739629.1 exopolysaccharide production repressor exox [Mesorhizobium sp. CO1-1-4]MBZ9801733.1 exopolysaccharide production repressor exox [Mesorhizobium sp. ES1-6]MBZ9992240.1 exopolysaccharide production repressor exox [Mesorhizobium sp. BH1-1-4]TPL84264.1 exopolysaccharide production repressor exox [Mesorhizobium sp. B2-3-12]